MATVSKDVTTCPVCLDEYAESDAHTPRMLPCTHTACDQCLRKLLKGNTELKCPECREPHFAPMGAKSFPQNKYIVGHCWVRPGKDTFDFKAGDLAKRDDGVARRSDKGEICQQHKEKFAFFCKDASCYKFICQVCLTSNHKDHDFVDKAEGEEITREENRKRKDALIREIATALDQQGKVESKVNRAGEKARRQLDASLGKLNRITKMIAGKVQEIEKEKQQVESNLDEVGAAIKNKADLLKDLRQAAQRSENVSEVAEKFTEIKTNLKAGKTMPFVFQYTTFGQRHIADVVVKALKDEMMVVEEKVESWYPLGKEVSLAFPFLFVDRRIFLDNSKHPSQKICCCLFCTRQF